jgi:peptidoglycan/xylan/chitin deacetylase (PgdA/CDA1 family)
VQLALRRRFLRVQERTAFPGWPQETALHDLEAHVLGLAERAAGGPLPWIAPWPGGRQWAVVLTHDVEHAAGLDRIDAVRAVEERTGLRSAWYFVPERDYTVTPERIDSLEHDGHEVALHGLRHDGRDLSEGTFDERLPAMQAYAARWGAIGFRSPATHRDWGRIGRLGLDHDSSWSDVARYEPQAGGSCSVLPFFVGDVVELPITLPMDHTLFELLGQRDASAWLEKCAFLRARGALAVLLTHPDYLLEDDLLAVYERFVAEVAADASAWHALPRDVSRWWRQRAASRLVESGQGWAIEGPAEGRGEVRLGAPEQAYAPGAPVA